MVTFEDIKNSAPAQFVVSVFGHSDEEVAQKVNEATQAAAAELESKKQSLQDQITNLTNELNALMTPEPPAEG
jgi:hypothetical protein